MEIVFRKLQSLTPAEKGRLRTLTLSDDSHLSLVLAGCPVRSCCWLAMENGEIQGWSLVRWFTPDVRSYLFGYISVFVAPSQRSQGLGKALVGQALNFVAAQKMTPCVFAVRAEQRAFFKACNLTVRQMTTQPFPRSYWGNYHFVKELLPQLKKAVWEVA